MHIYHICTFQSADVALKIQSSPLEFNVTFFYYKQCISTSLAKIQSQVQQITQGNHISDISKYCCDLENEAKVTKSNQLVPLPTMYICKFGPNPSNGSEDNAQKRSYGDADADADGIHTKDNMSHHPSGLGDIIPI